MTNTELNAESPNNSTDNKISTAPELINPQKNTYGEKFQDHLLEQYKMFVNLADQTSIRRGQASSFYISVLSALLALLSLVIEKKLITGFQSMLLLCTSILGLAICLTWYLNIQSYKQLNSLKFQVIHEMEQQLPFRCFSREWEILKAQNQKENNKKKYTRLTAVEKFVPLIFAIPYIGLMLYSVFNLLGIVK